MRLSPHFTLAELTFSQTAVRRGIDNTPDEQALANLSRLALVMEQVRDVLGGRAIIVSSGYRGPALNAAIGGSKTSAHMQGLACDFVCRGFGTPLAVAQEIAQSVVEFDQLISEYVTADGGGWVHLGLSESAPRRQLLSKCANSPYQLGLSICLQK